MKKQFLVLAAVATASVVTFVAISCKRNIDNGDNFTPRATQASTWYGLSLPEVTLPLTITSNRTLSADTLYKLDGKCFVTNNAILNIEAGTFIAGVKQSTTANASALIVTRGSKINAQGDPDNPIVFTSYQGCPKSGDWGGIVLLGRAPLNRADTTIEGINLPSVPAGVDINYGGGGACQGNVNDTSGRLQYVRIEYAGASIATDNELNGLTCGGVGAGTTLDHIESAWGADDAFEFFGGTVNAKYIIALSPDDDAFDFDFGYNGNIQFAVSILKAGNDLCGNTIDYSANPNGIESDNNATGDCNTCKKTRPVISNMTVVGLCDSTTAKNVPTAGLLNGAFFRRCSDLVVRNSVFMGFPTGVSFAGGSTSTNFQYSTVQAFTTVAAGGVLDGTCRSIRSASANVADINLLDPCDACSPDFRPQAGSTLLTDGVNYTGLPAFFVTKTYRGACASGTGTDAQWPNATWVVWAYPPYCITCTEGSCNN